MKTAKKRSWRDYNSAPIERGRRTGLVTYGYNSPADLPDWIEAHRSKHLNGEQRLMLKLLENAIEDANWKGNGCYKHATHNSSPAKHERERKNARDWIATAGHSWIFSFDSVCESLRIDPGWARKKIMAGYRKAA